MKYKILKTKDEIIELEQIRKRCYHINSDNIINNYYLQQIQNGSMISIACIDNDKFIAGVYISCNQMSLFIENLFVSDEYQNRGIARSIMQYVIDNKSIFEEYFKQVFIYSKLEPSSSSLIEFYKKIGYSEPNNLNIMKKRI